MRGVDYIVRKAEEFKKAGGDQYQFWEYIWFP